MYYRLNCDISIGELRITFVNDVAIDSSFKNMTSTCVIKLAKQIIVNRQGIASARLQDEIKAGQAVVVRLGYDNTLRTEFVGFVAKSPKPGPPVEVYVEDSMYILKRKRVKPVTFKHAKLIDVLKYIAPGFKIDCFDSSLGRTFTCGDTGAKVLKQLEDIYGFKSFFRLVGGVPILVAGKIYSSNDLLKLKPIKFVIGKNVIDHTLEYTSKEDKRVKVKAISKRDNAKDITVEVGDDDGDQRTLHLDLDLSAAELKKRALVELEKFKYDGYAGALTGFGIPFVRHGMAVTIIDEDYDKSQGSYFVDSVGINFGVSGFRRTMTIGPVVSDERRTRTAI